jgi:hypothetical protein
MSDQFDRLDRQLRSLARAARNEAAVGAADTEQALAEVTSGAQLARLRPVVDTGSSRRWQPWVAVAAATVLIVAGGVWLATRGDDHVRSVDPTVPAPAVSTIPTTRPNEVVTVPQTPPGETVTTSPATSPPPAESTAPATTTAPATEPAVPPLNDALLAGLYYEGSGIDNVCAADGLCTQVVFDPAGAAVSYDPTTRTVTRHGREFAGSPSFVLPGTRRASLLAAGPDRVVYIRVASDDPELDNVAAHSAQPGDQWREIRAYPGALGIGDYDVVPSPAGLVTVGWYGQGFQPESFEPVIEWVGRDGQPVTSPQPLVRLDYYEIAVEIGDRTWSFADPVDGAHPSRPPITPTFDGGFLAVLHHGADGTSAVVRGWSDGTVDTWYPPAEAGAWINVIPEPTGHVLVPHGDTFMRAELFPARPGDYWDGQRTTDVEAGTLTAVGLDEYLDANEPWWETDPIGLANAIAGPVSSPAERRTIEFRDDAVVVTTENYLDDSVYGTQLTFHLVASEGGPRIDRIDWTNTCQPGRGHQGYQAALCV